MYYSDHQLRVMLNVIYYLFITLLELKRYSHSYTDCPSMIIKYVYQSSGRTELAKENINNVIVSIPQGSEHYTFVNMRKNIYEEALFKVDFISFINYLKSVKMKNMILISH